MSFVEIDGNLFKRVLRVLKTVIGRSDEVFRKIYIKDGIFSATDGCLKVFCRVDERIKGTTSVSSDVLWALAKHSSGNIKISIEKGYCFFESDRMDLLLRGTGEPFPKMENCYIDLGKFKSDFLKGFDFVSKPLDEDDTVEMHVHDGVVILIGKTGGITGVFGPIKTREDVEWTGKFLYQPVRHFVKAVSGYKEFYISLGDSHICGKCEDVSFSLCADRVEKKVKPPKPSDNALKVDRKRFLSVLEAACDVLGKGIVTLEIGMGEMVIKGKRRGIEFKLREKISDKSERLISTVLPVRKFKSYISNMKGIIVYLSGGTEVVRFWDRSELRYVITKKDI